ncbi:TRAP transporter large permease [Caldovatus aquaticus]|uniref:TRAP transporter large permease protein n=1 Tax=Caldovatus aquaticus TaxID=2865671 RepID=A0ABS7EZA9_9PROT|nr:TRAP transporter large permease subunit [Caldovatus aquaticus]MBW8268691.1 TRAP transporter large permease subunit [Caldovatus aquaticus]
MSAAVATAVGLFVLLAVLGAPIAVTLGASTLVALLLFDPIPLPLIGQKILSNIDSTTLMAVPFFFLAAAFMETGGIVRRLVALAQALVGHWRGGIGMTGILACMFFAAISGSSGATVAAVGGIMIPAMIRQGYSRRYAVGSMTTAGSLGILIPPSIPMVLYGFLTETSIPKLFVAGVLPGIVFGLLLMALARLLAIRERVPVAPRLSWAERRAAFRDALPALSLPALLVVGIYGFPAFEVLGHRVGGGAIFTPTEAAVVCTALAALIGTLVYRDTTLAGLLRTMLAVTPRVGMIFWITTMAILFSFFLTQEGVPAALAQWLVEVRMPQWLFLLLVNVVLIVAGIFMDGVPMILLFMPILFPAAVELGVDPLHLCIIVVVNIELALISPPVGINLYVSSTIANVPLHEVVIASLPWVAVAFLMLLLVTYVPWLSTFLPGVLF